MCLCVHESSMPEEGVELPGTKVAGNCERPDPGAGNWVHALNPWAIPSEPFLSLFNRGLSPLPQPSPHLVTMCLNSDCIPLLGSHSLHYSQESWPFLKCSHQTSQPPSMSSANLSTEKTEAGEWVPGGPPVYSKFEVSTGYMRPWLNKSK